MAVDAQGYIYVAGDTFSSIFRGYNLPNYGGSDVLVLKLHPDDKRILAGAVIGSPSDDEVMGMGDFNGDGKADILWRNTHRDDGGGRRTVGGSAGRGAW